MNKELKFQTYFELKKEDAPTYIGNNFLVAADGLGGSGSNVHEIDRDLYYDLEGELLDAFYGDLKHKEEFKVNEKEYINELLKYLLDGVNRTSALWASRIVISRFVYAMKYHPKFKGGKNISSDNVREELSAFLTEGLCRTKAHFDLQEGKYSSQSMLPTTLAAIIFEDKKETDTVIAEAVWAGDSRCYAITADGLYQLSIDDEDESGAITNLFMVREGKQATLNYKRFEIKKPCVLITVSDGVFDPFSPHDNLGVENTFLNKIASCSSIDELNQNLYDIFAGVRGDDTTIAFLPFGVETYADIQQFTKNALSRNNEYVTIYVENKSKLEAMQLTDGSLDDYIVSRASDKFDKIVNSVVKCYMANDEVTDPFVKSVLEKVDFKALEDGAKRRFAEAVSAKKEFIVKDILEDKLLCGFDVRTIFTEKSDDLDKYYEAKAKYDAAINGVLDDFKDLKPYMDEHYDDFTLEILIDDEKNKYQLILSYLDKYLKELEATYQKPFGEVDYEPKTLAEKLNEDFLDGEGDSKYENNFVLQASHVNTGDDAEMVGNISLLNKKIKLWYTLRRYFDNAELLKAAYPKNKKGKIPQELYELIVSLKLNSEADNSEYSDILTILEFIEFRNKFLKELASIVSKFNQARSIFAKKFRTKALKNQYFGPSLERCSDIFTEDYVEELGLEELLIGNEPTKAERSEVIASDMQANKGDYVKCIVEVLKSNCVLRSNLCISDWFTGSRLTAFYDYYEVLENYDKYSAIDSKIKDREDEYESLRNSTTVEFRDPPEVDDDSDVTIIEGSVEEVTVQPQSEPEEAVEEAAVAAEPDTDESTVCEACEESTENVVEQTESKLPEDNDVTESENDSKPDVTVEVCIGDPNDDSDSED